MNATLLVLALSGCKTAEVPIGPPVGFFIEDGYDVAGFEAAPAVGNAPLDTVVRAVNRWGASVASEPAGFTVDGTSVTIPFDSLGYGRVRVENAGTTTIDDTTSVIEVTAFDSDWPGFGISRAFESAGSGASAAQGLTNGSVVAIGRELYYVGPETSPHRVLNADNAIRGMQSGHINVDGIEDLVVWSETTVYLMRGRLGGGLAFGAALTADPDDKSGAKYRVGGAAIGELNNDNLPDLVIAWSSAEGTSKLDEWHGNGLFGFKPAEPRNLPRIPISVSIGDATGEGTNQITVLTEDGTWARFIVGSEERYMPIGPDTPGEDIKIPLGSTVEAWGDLNGDGGDEMWFLGPLSPDTERRIVIVNLVGDKIEFLPINPMAAQIGRADLDGNGVVDHVELHGTKALRSMSFEAGGSNYTTHGLADLPAYGPLTIEDNLDLDGIPDLFVADDDVWWWWRGHNEPDNSEVYWNLGTQAMAEADTTIGPLVAAELNNDTSNQEIIGFRDNSGNTMFTIWSFDKATGAGGIYGEVVASAGGVDPLDMARCGNRVYATLEGQVARFDIANPASPVVGQSINSSATRVDCGAAPGGGVLAVLDNGTVQVMDLSLNVLSTLSAGGAEDLAIGDVGNGAEVATCATANCTVVLWDYGTGATFATGSDNQISVDDGGLQTLAGHGALSVGDVDGDGNLDLVGAGADGLFTVYRSTGDGWGMPELFHTPNPPVGAAAIADADGDGHADLWVRDQLDRLVYSTAPRSPSDQTTSGSSTGTGTTP